MQCRLCLIKCNSEAEVLLFDDENEDKLTKLIVKYLHLMISWNDPFSTMICSECAQSLKDFHKFYQTIEERQDLLRLKGLQCIQVDPIPNWNLGKEVECNKLHDHNIYEELPLDIKYVISEPENESINPLSQAENNNEDEDTEKNKISKPLEQPKLIKDNVLKSGANDAIVKSKSRDSPVKLKSTKGDSLLRTSVELKKFKNVLTAAEDKMRDDFIAQHMLLKCDICGIQINKFKELKTHFRAQHNTEMYVICCGRRLRKRFHLMDHLQTHLNPEYFKCEICNKVLKSRQRLELHKANKHSNRQELKFACTQCDKRFACSSNLKAHMIVHSDERNHLCEICYKGFKSSKFLKAHMIVHKGTTSFVCEACGRGYKNKLAFERHVAEHAEGPKQKSEQCPICGKWFMKDGVERHMSSHNAENVECKYCGKILKSKIALRGHIGYSHREKIFNCTLCDKKFKRASVLKEHIAMHTGQKDYNCPHCYREFRSRANMYAHVKKTHVEEWTQAQLDRNRGPNKQNDGVDFTSK